MATDIFKGENKLIEYELSDSSGTGITFASLQEATVTLKDYSGNTRIYTKTDSTKVKESTTTSIEIEYTDTEHDPLD